MKPPSPGENFEGNIFVSPVMMAFWETTTTQNIFQD
jgi:hypothetical protein